MSKEPRSMSVNELDEIATRYHLSGQIDGKDFDVDFHRICADWILNITPPQSKILELGYGEGNFSSALIKGNHQVTLLEGSSILAEKAKSEFGNKISVIHSLFEDFEATEKYDLILATNILEHVDQPDQILKLIHKWCTKNTKVIASVPNAESLHRRLAVLMGLQPELGTLSPRDHQVGHQRVYTAAALVKQVVASDFQVLEVKGFQLKVLPNSMMAQFSRNLLDAFNNISGQIPPEFLANIAVVLKIK